MPVSGLRSTQSSSAISINTSESDFELPLDVVLTVSNDGNIAIISFNWSESILAGVRGNISYGSDKQGGNATSAFQSVSNISSYTHTITFADTASGTLIYRLDNGDATASVTPVSGRVKTGPPSNRIIHISYDTNIQEGVSNYVIFDMPDDTITESGQQTIRAIFKEIPDDTVNASSFVVDGIDADITNVNSSNAPTYIITIDIPENIEGVLSIRLA